jgi:hypothetical protein
VQLEETSRKGAKAQRSVKSSGMFKHCSGANATRQRVSLPAAQARANTRPPSHMILIIILPPAAQ